MGNQPPSCLGILPSPELKWKTGKKANSIPCPLLSETTNLDKLSRNVDLKDYILRNIDSDLLMSSLLVNSQREELYSNGIQVFQTETDKDALKKSKKTMETLENLTRIGVKVNKEELMALFRHEMFSSANICMNPFFKSLQRRLAVLRGIDGIIAHERSLANDLRRSREFTGTFLNSTKHPQALLINTMITFGEGVLKAFPLIASQSETLPVILTAINSFSKSFSNISDSALFHAWSPRASPPMKAVALNIESAKSSGGNPKDAIDGQKITSWSVSSSKGEWSVDLESVSDICGVRIAWAPSPLVTTTVAGAATVIGAPKKLIIRITFKPEDNETDICEKDFIFEPEHEFQRQGNWIQTYLTNVSNVTAVKIIASKYSMTNQSTIRIHHLEVLRVNAEAVWTDIRESLNNIETGLFPLFKYQTLQSSICSTVISLIRTSASLGLFIQFVIFSLSNNINSDVITNESKQLLQLVTAIHSQIAKQKCRVIFGTGETVEEVVTDVSFDPKAKSTDIHLEDEGTIAVSPSSGTNSYALATPEMNDGIWVWEMIILDDSYGDESTCLGVGRRPITNTNYETSPDLWTIRCYSGETYHIQRLAARNVNPAIHPNDVCRFTYDADRMTVSLAVNDTDRGILFENVPPGISPLAFFYGNKKKIQITNMKHKVKHNLENSKAIDSSVAGPIPSLDDIKANPSILSLLLQMISTLCEARVSFFEYRERERKPKHTKLDYPYCIEASVQVLNLILELLMLLNSKLENTINLDDKESPIVSDIISLLTILQTQFYVIKQSNIDLHEIGFQYKVSKISQSISFLPGPGLTFIDSSKIFLSSLMLNTNTKIKAAAISAFAQGSLLFFPNMDDKLEALANVLNDTDLNKSVSGNYLFLNMILKDLSTCSSALQIIELVSNKPSYEQLWKKITDKLCVLLALAESNLINSINTPPTSANDIDRAAIIGVFSHIQQQTLYEIITESDLACSENDVVPSSVENILIHQTNGILFVCASILACLDSFGIEKYQGSKIDTYFQESSLYLLLNPLAHMLCFCVSNCRLMHGILSNYSIVVDAISSLVKKSSYCQRHQAIFYNSIPKTRSPQSNSTGPGGWKIIPCRLEENASGFSIRDNGTLFSSLHSSNTCASAAYIFPANSKGAWEFKLEQDSLNDECSVFGAARPNFSSRCYNSSPDLWMRRSYNGSLYQNGNTLSQSMEKIHPGDVIRIEFDGKLGTLSSSVNGSPMEVMFTGIHEPVCPVCGSYRSGIQIRLIKVEIYQDSIEATDSQSLVDQDKIEWVLDLSRNDCRESSILKMSKEYKPQLKKSLNWVTNRADTGIYAGVHDVAFEVLENKSKELIAVGLVFGCEPLNNGDHLAGRMFKISDVESNQCHKVSDPTSLLVETESVNAYQNAKVESSNNKESAENDLPVKPLEIKEVAWKLDGSLWVNGEERYGNFGSKFLPVKQLSVISMRVNLDEKTLSFYVNGSFVGVAFGPSNSNPAVVLPISSLSCFDSYFSLKGATVGSKTLDSLAIYPAASVSSANQSIKIITGGFYGTLMLPAQINIQKTVTAVYGRMCSSLICGIPRNKQENEISPWLQSPLLRGGFDNQTSKIENLQTWGSSLDDARKSFSQFLNSFGVNSIHQNALFPTQVSLTSSNFPSFNFPIEDEVNQFLNQLATTSRSEDKNGEVDDKVMVILNWMESIQPELMRDFLEKRGLYSFSICERPYIACMLKHSGLTKEALLAYDCLRKGLIAPTASSDMITLWSRVKQLRQYLRKKRQELAAKAEDMSPSKESQIGALSVPPSPVKQSSTGIAIEPSEDIVIDKSGFLTSDIIWKEQKPGTICSSEEDDRLNCKIISVGIDYPEELVYIKFSLTIEPLSGDEVSPETSTLMINDESFGNPKTEVTKGERNSSDGSQEVSGFIRFEIGSDFSHHELFNSVMSFTFSSSGYVAAKLQLPFENSRLSKAGDSSVVENYELKSLSTFDEICNAIAERAVLLLNMTPTLLNDDSTNHFTSKRLLLSLMDRYTTKQEMNTSISSLPNSPKRFGSPARDRWSRVIDFLRVHSRARRQSSHPRVSFNTSLSLRSGIGGDVSIIDDFLDIQDAKRPTVEFSNPETGEVDEFDSRSSLELSSSQAAIQACALFVTGEAVNISPKGVIGVIKRRTIRAKQRMFALDALRSTLESDNYHSDPFSICNLLLFVQSALTEYQTSTVKDSVIKYSNTNKIHYLVNLEGCSLEALTKVQEAFMGCYTTLVQCAANFFQLWEDSSSGKIDSSLEPPHIFSNQNLYLDSISLLLSMWNISFSNRDFRFLVHCGLLPLLFKIISLSSMEKSVERWSSIAAESCHSLCLESTSPITTLQPIKLSSLSQGFKNGTSSYRYILHKLIEFAPHLPDLHSLENMLSNFKESPLITCAESSDLLFVYEEAKSVISMKIALSKKAEEAKIAMRESIKAKKYEEIKLKTMAIGAFEDSTHSGMVLSQYNLLLTVRNDSSSVARCLGASFEYNFDQEPSEKYGNYFEVEIIESGPTKDIGIGLADISQFSITNKMPGWDDHSYGYHGDDGQKHGKNKTPGDWPLYSEGDVIGCGYNTTERSIFFTKNGELLGNGFINIPERKLKAVVGFTFRHNSIQQVRINFGKTGFMYNGPEVIMNPKVSDEKNEEDTSNSIDCDDEANENEELVIIKPSKQQQSLTSASSYISECSRLRSLSFTLIRHLLLVLDGAEDESENDEVVDRQHDTHLSSKTSAVLSRGLSSFGTLKSITLEDGKTLREEISAIMVQELLVGSKYINSIPSKLPLTARSIFTEVNRFGEALELLTTSFTGKFLMSEVQNEDDMENPENMQKYGYLEKPEVESVLFQHLRILLTLLPFNSSLKEEMLTVRSLHSLLAVLRISPPRMQQIVIKIFQCILPDSNPDDVEAATLNDWIDGRNQPIHSANSNPNRRSRRIPDTFIREVLDKIHKSVSCTPGKLGIQIPRSSGVNGVGYGDAMLSCSDEYVRLIQVLLENSVWTEIVACSLTEAFRHAVDFLQKTLNDNSIIESKWSQEGENIIGLACSAAACLSGLNVIREGANVILPSGSFGKILFIDSNNNNVEVILDNDKSYVSTSDLGTKIETVSMSRLSLSNCRINLDFSRLSQPLIPNLVNLFKVLLQYLDDPKNNESSLKSINSINVVMNRAVFLVSNAVSTLMEYQSELMNDAIQDVDVLQHVISLSLLPISISNNLNSNQLHLAWLSFQSRLLEKLEGDSIMPFQETLEVSVPSVNKVHRLESESIDLTSLFVLDPKSYLDSYTISELLSNEFNLNPRVCQRYLLFYKMDIIATKDALKVISGIEDKSLTSPVSIEFANSIRSTDRRSEKGTAEFQDSNIVLNSDKGVTSVLSKSGKKSTPIMFLDSVKIDDIPAIEVGTLFTESDYIGIVDDAADDFHNRIYSYVKAGTVDNELVLCFYDPILGSNIFETKNIQKLKVVKSWFGQDTKWSPNVAASLDLSLALTKIRYLSTTLLLEGSLGPIQQSNKVENWIRLLKLNFQVNERSNNKSIESPRASQIMDMDKLFRAVISIGSDSSEYVKMEPITINKTSLSLPLLINDIKENIKMLTYSNLQAGKNLSSAETSITDDIPDFNGYLIGSPHPFVSPSRIDGKLSIPPSWSGISIKFHPNTRLPSKGSSLKLYKSTDDFKNNKPSLEYVGGTNSLPQSLSLLGVNSLFYTFDAKAGSEKKSISLKRDANIKSDCDTLSLRPDGGGPVGLGEEDTLFSLFDLSSSVSSDRFGYASADSEGVSRGCWYYEASVTFENITDDSSILALTRIGFDTNDVDNPKYLLGDNESKDYNALAFSFESFGTVHLHGNKLSTFDENSKVPVTKVGENYVVGCLIDIDDENSVVRFRFSVNGIQSKWNYLLPEDQHGMSLNFKPAFSVGPYASIACNFGENPFIFPPNDILEWNLFQNRPAQATELGWGYEFTVDSVNEVSLGISRRFTCVYKPEDEDKVKPEDAFWIWRPICPTGHGSIGDIITFTSECPIGAIVVEREKCVAPTKYELVAYSTSINLSIWRPVPPVGYVALGDVAVNKGGTTSKPSFEACLCVPSFVLDKCQIGKKLISSRKGGSSTKYFDFSIWSTNNETGTFFASPCDRTEILDGKSKPDEINLSGVGVSYKFLKYSIGNIINGEWMNEGDIETGPSLSWTSDLLKFILDEPSLRSSVINSSMFFSMIEFFRSDSSPDPIRLLPSLIKMVRFGFEKPDVTFPFSKLEKLNASIFSHAISQIQDKATQKIADKLLSLVDLVVEYEHGKLVSQRQHLTSRARESINDKEDLQLISVEDVEINISNLELNEPPLGMNNSQDKDKNVKWWERPLFSSSLRKECLHDMDEAEIEQLIASKASGKAQISMENLRSAIAFLFSLEARFTKKEQELTNVFLSKLWYKYFSNCVFLESEHPCKNKHYTKKICIPGAEKLKITFDRRCLLATGVTLRITPALGASATFTSTCGWQVDKAINFNGDTITVTYEPNEEEGDKQQEWGWALLVTASGNIYETSQVFVEIGSQDATNNSTLQLTDTYSKSDDNSSHQIPDVHRPPSRREPRSSETQLKSHNDPESIDKEILLQKEPGFVSSGTMEIPYATEAELVLERVFIGDDTDQTGSMDVTVTYTEDDEEKTAKYSFKRSSVSGEDSFTIKIKSNKIHYSVSRGDNTPTVVELSKITEEVVKEPVLIVDTVAPEENAEFVADPSVEMPTIYPPALAVVDTVSSESPAGWDCPVCTVFNLEDANICIACEAPRGADSTATDSLGWWCPICTFMNALSSTSCSMCSAARPSDGAAAADFEGEDNDGDEDEDEEEEDDEEEEEEDSNSDESSESNEETSEKLPVAEEAVNASAKLSKGKEGVIIRLNGKLTEVGKFMSRMEGCLTIRRQLEVDSSVCLPTDLINIARKWSFEADTALLEYINGETMNSSNKNFFAKIESVGLPLQFVSYRASSLSQYNLLEVQSRIMSIKCLNDSMEDIIHIVNLSNQDPLSLGSLVRKYSRYLLLNLKQPMLDQVIKSTTIKSGSAAGLVLDNEKALESRDAKQFDITTSQCCFVQAYQQLSAKDSSVYRYVFSGDRVFQINFKGEDGIDAGGVFREGMSRMIEDLFSPNFNLLILCPNGQHLVHVNTDKYVPNPCQKSPLALKMFQFVGRLMATSIRVKLYLPFEFPSIVWKKIVGEDVSIDDLMAIDSVTCTFLAALRDCDKEDITDEMSFARKYKQLKFVYNGSDGVERELKRGQNHRTVSFANRHEYCDAVLNARLQEFDEQIAAITAGMNEVIPLRFLQLFSWQQLETLVGGSPTFDIALWKSKTDATGVPAKTLELFWKVIESLSTKEQAGFVRFAWGRSRLPSEKDFTTKMRLTNAGSHPLPVAHTCFFSIELPEYTTESAMRHGILTAIHFGVGGILMG